MKATGRRAWRQAERRFRKAERKRGFSPPSSMGAFARRHWRAVDGTNGIVGKQFPPRVETKPFIARSLVGMSMGARKRAAKSEGVRIGCKAGPKICDKLRKRMWRVWAQAPYARTARTEELAKIWQDMYAKYRIGERLRPCPGCFHCQPGVKGWHIDRTRSGRFNMPTLALHCDGSGVLLARKQG